SRPAARATESSENFVRDQLRAVAARNLGGATQPTGRLGDHSGCALNQRFKYERGVGIAALLLCDNFAFELIDAFPVALAIFAGVGAIGLRAIERATVTIRRRRLVGFEQQTGIRLVKEIDVTERNGADGVAVIRAVERKKLRAGPSGAPREFVSEL